jgi:hypothetical protein
MVSQPAFHRQKSSPISHICMPPHHPNPLPHVLHAVCQSSTLPKSVPSTTWLCSLVPAVVAAQDSLPHAEILLPPQHGSPTLNPKQDAPQSLRSAIIPPPPTPSNMIPASHHNFTPSSTQDSTPHTLTLATQLTFPVSAPSTMRLPHKKWHCSHCPHLSELWPIPTGAQPGCRRLSQVQSPCPRPAPSTPRSQCQRHPPKHRETLLQSAPLPLPLCSKLAPSCAHVAALQQSHRPMNAPAGLHLTSLHLKLAWTTTSFPPLCGSHNCEAPCEA